MCIHWKSWTFHESDATDKRTAYMERCMQGLATNEVAKAETFHGVLHDKGKQTACMGKVCAGV